MRRRHRRQPPSAFSAQAENPIRAVYSGLEGNRADRMAELLAAAEQRVARIDRELNPAAWAAAMLTFGHVRSRQLYGEPRERYEETLDAMRAVYSVYVDLGDVRGMGRAATAIGTALKNRISENHAEDLEKSIRFHRLAISLACACGDAGTVANAHAGLGLAYLYRERGEPSKNILEAVRHTRLGANGRSSRHRRAVLATGEGIAWMQLPNEQLGMRRATAAFRRARRLLDAGSHPADARRLGRRAGSAHLARRQWAAARDYYEMAVTAGQRLTGSAQTEEGYRHERAALGDLYAHAVYANALAGDGLLAAALAEEARAKTATTHGGDLDARIPSWRWLGSQEALAYVVTTSYGGAAVVIQGASGSDAEPIPFVVGCPELRRDQLNTMVDQARSAPGHGGTVTEALVRYGPREARPLMKQPLARVLDYLDVCLWQPLRSKLLERGVLQVNLVPFGPLVVLPLHAAQSVVEGRLISSYSISALIGERSRKNAVTSTRRKPRLLAIGAASGPRGLDGAEPEVRAAIETFPGPSYSLIGRDVSVERIYDAATTATHIHMACHGVFDAVDPAASHFELAGGERLTVEQLLTDRPFDSVRLLVATACSMGTSDYLLLPDEPTGLPTAAIMSGVAGVIAPLRVLPDLIAPLFTSQLYQSMFAGATSEPAAALAKTQNWLRLLTAQDLRDWLANYPGLFPDLPSGEVDGARPSDPLWAHVPAIWAPFCHFGT